VRGDFLIARLALLNRHVSDVGADEISYVSLLPLKQITSFAATHVEHSQRRSELNRVFDSLEIIAYQHAEMIEEVVEYWSLMKQKHHQLPFHPIIEVSQIENLGIEALS
jgi:hypothetical protein